MYWLLLKTFRRIWEIAHNGESADKLELIGLTLGPRSKGASPVWPKVRVQKMTLRRYT